ncbi:hypothetical protein [Nonomuraea sp. NPDC048916]|uniref:hypothetical protein n=1 Tax=Nonomuraea sp. NPDC048916 TaxID=3154232 RepID=UPI0033FD4D0C
MSRPDDVGMLMTAVSPPPAELPVVDLDVGVPVQGQDGACRIRVRRPEALESVGEQESASVERERRSNSQDEQFSGDARHGQPSRGWIRDHPAENDEGEGLGRRYEQQRFGDLRRARAWSSRPPTPGEQQEG